MAFARFRIASPLLAALLFVTACAEPLVTVTDTSPESNPCPEDLLTQFEYDSLRRILAQILTDQVGIVAAIEAQVRENVGDAEGGAEKETVRVDVRICTREEFIEDYVRERGGPDATEEERAELRARAGDRFDRLAGLTYTVSGERRIRIMIFCKEGLSHNPSDPADARRLRQLFIHELVHAKLYASELHGVPKDRLPFRDHGEPPEPEGGDRRFYGEIERLLGMLPRTPPPIPEEPEEENH